MKKTTFAFLSILLLAAGISSCAKTNRKKLVNDWKITSSESESNEIQDGETNYSSVSMNETSITQVYGYGPTGNVEYETRSGSVITNDFTIREDGTWSRNMEYNISGNATTFKYIAAFSGTWYLAGKSRKDDYKRNERVVFNTLNVAEKQIVIPDAGAQYTETDHTFTLSSGTEQAIYVVKKSRNKELQLEAEESENYTVYAGSTYIKQFSRMNKLTLTQK